MTFHDFPIMNGDFEVVHVCLPDGKHHVTTSPQKKAEAQCIAILCTIVVPWRPSLWVFDFLSLFQNIKTSRMVFMSFHCDGSFQCYSWCLKTWVDNMFKLPTFFQTWSASFTPTLTVTAPQSAPRRRSARCLSKSCTTSAWPLPLAADLGGDHLGPKRRQFCEQGPWNKTGRIWCDLRMQLWHVFGDVWH